MRHLFAVPWPTPSGPTLLGIAVVAILVFGAFAFLKATNGVREL
jgi:Sec-independent protein translocase protein TatA